MQVEIRSLFNDQPVPQPEFAAAVDYLKSRGATFHGPTKTWMVDASVILADVPEGCNISNHLRTKSIEIFHVPDCEQETVRTWVGGWERANEMMWEASRVATAEAAALRAGA